MGDTDGDCEAVAQGEDETVPDRDSVLEGQCDADGVLDWDNDSDGETDCVSDPVEYGDCDRAPLSVKDVEMDTESVCEVEDEIVTERHCVTVPVRDAMDGDGDGVDPAGAQNGPMLNVARCVPSRDASGDADAMDCDPVADGKAVGNCSGSVGRGGGGACEEVGGSSHTHVGCVTHRRCRRQCHGERGGHGQRLRGSRAARRRDCARQRQRDRQRRRLRK